MTRIYWKIAKLFIYLQPDSNGIYLTNQDRLGPQLPAMVLNLS